MSSGMSISAKLRVRKMDGMPTMQQSIRVMLADDHAVVRSGLRRLLERKLEIEVIAEAENGDQAYQFYSQHLPDVAVLDLSMPGMGGMEVIRRIHTKHPEARLLVFSMHESAAFATQALKAGACGYVAKTGSPEELVVAVQEAMKGKVYISKVVAQKIAVQSLSGGTEPVYQLSSREFEIFRMIAEGNSVEEVADKLKISQKTVANYLTLIKQKLGVHTPIEMLRLAMRHGVIRE